MRQFLLLCIPALFASHFILPSQAGPLDFHKSIQRSYAVGSSILERQLPPSPEFECHLSNSPDPFLSCAGLLQKYNVTREQLNVYNEGVGIQCQNYVPGQEYCVRASRITPVSVDGTCGMQAETRVTCVGSEFGDCCSATGWCGSTPQHCGIGYCQEGNCPGLGYSIDGKCGLGILCGGPYGNCCSNSGWCGSTPDHCGVGNCQSGACDGSTSTTTETETTTPTATETPQDPPGGVSPDGTCGYDNEYTCVGSIYGNCCSAAGWCGNTKFYCSDLLGCQPEFGVCDQTVVATVTYDPATVTVTMTASA